MKTPMLLVQFCAAAVLAAPLSLPGTSNENTIKELKLTRFVEPLFPESVRVEGVAEGSVTLAVSRSQAGEPVDILVLRATNPGLATAAVEAVREWRFAPADNPELAPKVIQLGFKLQGVVIFPYGKKVVEEMSGVVPDLEMRSSKNVPDLRTLTHVPKALAQPMPQYPASLASKGQEGRVAVKFYVDQDGKVRLPEVIEATDPEFAAAALNAVSQWRYAPPRNGGRSVVARDHWEFKFQASN
jgi:TonB family protein